MTGLKALNRLGALSALVLAACSTGGPNAATGALQASENARAYGVYAYRVTGVSMVALVGADGSELGTLRVSDPSADMRLVEIAYPDGRIYSDEVTRPVDGAFRAPLRTTSREEIIQLDPALAPTFAAHQLAFETLAGPAQLTPSTVASCSNLSFPSTCEKQLRLCDTATYSSGTLATAYAACPRVSCKYDYLFYFSSLQWNYSESPGYDGVSKTQSCATSGSCTTQANGYQGCMGCPYGLNPTEGNDCEFEY